MTSVLIVGQCRPRPDRARPLDCAGCYHAGSLNMTYFALLALHQWRWDASRRNLKKYVPWVSDQCNYKWRACGDLDCSAFCDLFDRHLSPWRRDNRYLRCAIGIPVKELRLAHRNAKSVMIDAIKKATDISLDETWTQAPGNAFLGRRTPSLDFTARRLAPSYLWRQSSSSRSKWQRRDSACVRRGRCPARFHPGGL